MKEILVTNALPYANGHLHLGHMLGYIQSDIWVRHQKMKGNRCYFICGSDCHGTPIMLKAKKMGIKPEKLANDMTSSHLADFIDFEIEFDNYQSTHNPIHQSLVEQAYALINEKGFIESKVIHQAYDEQAQIFLPDRYVKGTCPKCGAEDQNGDSCEVCSSTYAPTELINPISEISGTTPIQKETEHYFFNLNAVKDSIYSWLKSNKHLQSEVVNKLKEWLEGDLKDWDISRDSPYFGYKIPDTQDKYFYVWLDAPLGYLASFKDLCNKLNIDFDRFWRRTDETEVYHFIGKDIIYFHALFWPAILETADYRKSTGIFANGFLSINGAKMSKSRGTFILAKSYLNHLDPEYLRYYFASKLTSGIDDIDLNLNDFSQKVNSDLVGKVINIASRCAGFITKKFDGKLSETIMDESLYNEFIQQRDSIMKDYDNREYAYAMRKIMALADKANQFIDYHKPWQIAKTEGNTLEVQQVCTMGLNLFKILITYLKPVIPNIAQKSEAFLRTDTLDWFNVEQPLIDHDIAKFKPLLKRIEQDKITAILQEG